MTKREIVVGKRPTVLQKMRTAIRHPLSSKKRHEFRRNKYPLIPAELQRDEAEENFRILPEQQAEIDQPETATLSRQDKLLCLISRDMKILEIGPAYNPSVPRSQGWNSFSLDHATQEELKNKYRGQQLIENIEPVDFLWRSGPIELAVPPEHLGTFDAFIASHVIEHIPDPISFFQSAAKLLNTNGVLALAIPDKRVMFDFFKPITTTGDYLYAYHLKRTRHSKKTAFDNLAFHIGANGQIVWGPQTVINQISSLSGENALDAAFDAFSNLSESNKDPYIDFHATIYTPSSFALIMFELGQLGLLPFSIAKTFPTEGCEFHVSLRKESPPRLSLGEIECERRRLMILTIRELADQARAIATF